MRRSKGEILDSDADILYAIDMGLDRDKLKELGVKDKDLVYLRTHNYIEVKERGGHRNREILKFILTTNGDKELSRRDYKPSSVYESKVDSILHPIRAGIKEFPHLLPTKAETALDRIIELLSPKYRIDCGVEVGAIAEYEGLMETIIPHTSNNPYATRGFPDGIEAIVKNTSSETGYILVDQINKREIEFSVNKKK